MRRLAREGMGPRLTTATVFAVLATAIFAAGALAVGAVRIYRNDMNSPTKRGDLRQQGKGQCERGGSERALRVEVGKRTRVCSFQTPVVGRDLELAVTARLLSGTPDQFRKRMFLALNLRDGEGGRYQLAVFPRRREWRLRRDQPEGSRRLLDSGKLKRIGGINEANKIRLRAFNVLKTKDNDDARLIASINGKRVTAVNDRKAGPIQGRNTAVGLGAKKASRGAVASFDNIRVRVPDPFAK